MKRKQGRGGRPSSGKFRSCDGYYQTFYDPTHTFPVGGRFTKDQFETGLKKGLWPNNMILRTHGFARTNKFRIVAQKTVTLQGSKREAVKIAQGLRRHENIVGTSEVREQYLGWSFDQLVDELVRMGRLIGTEPKEEEYGPQAVPC